MALHNFWQVQGAIAPAGPSRWSDPGTRAGPSAALLTLPPAGYTRWSFKRAGGARHGVPRFGQRKRWSCMSDALSEANFQAALDRQGIELPAEQVARLVGYVRLLWSWNERLNLTRHLDVETFVARDLVDSWQLAQHLASDERVLDLGTGGGVPGVVVALLRPDLQMSLCDSVQKKAAAVSAIVDELQLPVAVHAEPVQSVLASGHSFDTLVARAVGPMWKVLKWLKPHWGSFGRLLLIKGPKWAEERGQARHLGYLASLNLRRVATYATAGHDGENVVLSITPADDQGKAARRSQRKP